MALVTASKDGNEDDMLNVPATMSELDDDVIEQIRRELFHGITSLFIKVILWLCSILRTNYRPVFSAK